MVLTNGVNTGGQIISEKTFGVLNLFDILQISALAPKEWSNKKK